MAVFYLKNAVLSFTFNFRPVTATVRGSIGSHQKVYYYNTSFKYFVTEKPHTQKDTQRLRGIKTNTNLHLPTCFNIKTG